MEPLTLIISLILLVRISMKGDEKYQNQFVFVVVARFLRKIQNRFAQLSYRKPFSFIILNQQFTLYIDLLFYTVP